jgi:hypothetical protein
MLAIGAPQRATDRGPRPMGNRQLAWLGNSLVVFVIVALGAIESLDRDVYYRAVQEDGAVEWATVLLLIPGMWLSVAAARRARTDAGAFRWFFVGLGAFCLFFAGEEISWGQRLMAYQPPEYFLEHNTQQELNLHNLFKHAVRTKYLLMGIVGLWGVLLPALHAFVAPARRLLDRLGFVVPPFLLAPAFAAVGILSYVYPWKYTGEVAECLFALLLTLTITERAHATVVGDGRPPVARTGLAIAVAVGLAALIPPLMDTAVRGSDTERVARAQAETEALASDWRSHQEATGRGPSSCGAHIRVFTWVRKYELQAFRGGAFAGLGIDEARRDYFLDPWNNPYWIRHVCEGRRPKGVFIYSFGPDSHRDSNTEQLRGDDVGVVFVPSR